MANNQNLRPKPWPKGVSGNPAGLPKGYVRASTILNKLLQGKMTVEEAGKKLKRTRQEVLLMKLVVNAYDPKNTASEQVKAAAEVLNRIEGKPVQPIGAAPDTAVQITISPAEDRL